MFDTINLRTSTFIHPDYLQQAESFTFIKGGVRTKYKLRLPDLTWITYKAYTESLEISLSIPKFLYGNNVNLLKESDIPLFFQRLQIRLQELFNINVRMEDWYLTRVDVCWNFRVNDNMDDYLKELATIKIPRMKPETQGISETVIHKNMSKRISFYNKKVECCVKNQPQPIVDQAEGLLRMEVNLKGKNLSKYSAKRKATELLTKPFFDYTMQPILKQIKFPPTVERFTLQWFENQSYSIKQIETILGFYSLKNFFAEPELKKIYKPNTYDRRMQQSQQIVFPKVKSLEPLHIDSIG